MAAAAGGCAAGWSAGSGRPAAVRAPQDVRRVWAAHPRTGAPPYSPPPYQPPPYQPGYAPPPPYPPPPYAAPPYATAPTGPNRRVLALVGVLAVVAITLVAVLAFVVFRGNPRDTADAFMAALRAKDIDKAHSLLCKDGQQKESKEQLRTGFDLDQRTITGYQLGTERERRREGKDETLIPVTITYDQGCGGPDRARRLERGRPEESAASTRRAADRRISGGWAPRPPE